MNRQEIQKAVHKAVFGKDQAAILEFLNGLAEPELFLQLQYRQENYLQISLFAVSNSMTRTLIAEGPHVLSFHYPRFFQSLSLGQRLLDIIKMGDILPETVYWWRSIDIDLPSAHELAALFEEDICPQ